MITNTKYLGLQIDSQLKWDKRIDTIKTKANRSLGLIKYTKKYLPSDVLNKIYRGIVEPQLSYGCSIWDCCGESKISALQTIENIGNFGKVKSMFSELGVDIPDAVIDRENRIGRKTMDANEKHKQQVIVRFTTWRHRTTVYRTREKIKSIKIRLDLTKPRLDLLSSANNVLKTTRTTMLLQT